MPNSFSCLNDVGLSLTNSFNAYNALLQYNSLPVVILAHLHPSNFLTLSPSGSSRFISFHGCWGLMENVSYRPHLPEQVFLPFPCRPEAKAPFGHGCFYSKWPLSGPSLLGKGPLFISRAHYSSALSRFGPVTWVPVVTAGQSVCACLPSTCQLSGTPPLGHGALTSGHRVVAVWAAGGAAPTGVSCLRGTGGR